MSLFPQNDRFALVREPAGSRFHARLVEAGRISQAIIAARRTPELLAPEGFWSEAELFELAESLDYCAEVRYQEKTSRFEFTFEGVDANLYLLSIAALSQGFDVFACSASLSQFRLEDDPLQYETHYQGTADFVEHFAVGAPTAQHAYLQGLWRIAAQIRTNQRKSGPPRPNRAAEGMNSPPDSEPVRSFASSNLATWDAGFFAYSFGLLGTAAMMATGVGPGWLGFFAAFVPASVVAAWVVAHHA